MTKPTKLKDLPKIRRLEAQKKRGIEMVENSCGCIVPLKERYWTIKFPLMPVQVQGKSATLVAVIAQCNKCTRNLDGKGEFHTKQEPLISVPGGLS